MTTDTPVDKATAVLAMTVFLAPALGVPHDEIVQDTLKSAVVALGVLAAALLFFWQQRERREPLHTHALLLLPLGLMAYALASMTWSHAYLGGVEAVRWFVFSVLLWLGLNSFTGRRATAIVWGVHAGAVVAALWTALQFWLDFRYFPQGPNPASTFANRNFYAEYAVCTVGFGALLLARARNTPQILLLALTSGLVIVSVLMTGTRAALLALWVQLLLLLPLAAMLWRRELALTHWRLPQRALAAGVLLATVAGLGTLPTQNARLIEEHLGGGRGLTALERGFKRTASISLDDGSLGVRMAVWQATGRMIRSHPLGGVGAGAWEAHIPPYLTGDDQLENDFDYAHNEYLQLVAEYGLASWLFLISMAGLLLAAAWRTLRPATPQALSDAPVRAMALSALTALFIVSLAGFPWRLASTSALFAVCLGLLAASDVQRGCRHVSAAWRLRWRPAFSQWLAVGAMASLGLAVFITLQAVECERKLVQAYRIALAMSKSGPTATPQWNAYKADMLRLLQEGTAINPHYRKLTPRVADELARWGDWKNAVAVWEGIASSRPRIVVILTHIARGYALMDQQDKAFDYLERARKIQPDARSVRSLEVVLLSRTGQEARALGLAREALATRRYDYDLVNTAFVLAWRAGDHAFARQALDLRMTEWPATRALGLAQLGNLYLTEKKPDQALASFRQAVALTPEPQRAALQPQIPQAYWPTLGLVTPAPPRPAVASR